jgi:hypothetical protein
MYKKTNALFNQAPLFPGLDLDCKQSLDLDRKKVELKTVEADNPFARNKPGTHK